MEYGIGLGMKLVSCSAYYFRMLVRGAASVVFVLLYFLSDYDFRSGARFPTFSGRVEMSNRRSSARLLVGVK